MSAMPEFKESATRAVLAMIAMPLVILSVAFIDEDQ